MFDEIISWLVGVQSRDCSSSCNCIIISLLSFFHEGVIQFWAKASALGLKKWLKSQGHWHNTKKNSPWMLACHVMGESKASLTFSCAISRDIPRVKRSKILVGPRDWLPERLGWFLGVLLLMWKVCILCFCQFNFLNMT